MDWKQLLVYITGSVNQELLLRVEYLVTENRLLRSQIQGRVRLTDAERKTLAEIGKQLGKRVLEEIVSVVKPDTILAWHRRFVAQENRSWGYDRIAGALADLGYTISDQTVGNILKRHDIPSAPERRKTTGTSGAGVLGLP